MNKPCRRCKQVDTPQGIHTCEACREALEQKRAAALERVAKELGQARMRRGLKQQVTVIQQIKRDSKLIDDADKLAEAVEELPDILKTIELKRALARYWKSRGY